MKFKSGQRKNALTQEYLRRFRNTEGLLYIGKAQEKARAMRAERRRQPEGLNKESGLATT